MDPMHVCPRCDHVPHVYTWVPCVHMCLMCACMSCTCLYVLGLHRQPAGGLARSQGWGGRGGLSLILKLGCEVQKPGPQPRGPGRICSTEGVGFCSFPQYQVGSVCCQGGLLCCMGVHAHMASSMQGTMQAAEKLGGGSLGSSPSLALPTLDWLWSL